jgi:outer membrane protein assembly factor BamB
MVFMKKLILVLVLIICLGGISSGQNIKYAWIINPGIGNLGADSALANIVANINSDSTLGFAIVSGNLTAHGLNKELEQIKSILDNLSIPYRIIPGENDLRWSESAGREIKSVFENDHFIFRIQNTFQIGLNNSVTWRNGIGHFSPEEISWCSDTLNSIPMADEIFLYSYFPFDTRTDNWFKITNLLINHNVIALLADNGKPKTISLNSIIPTITGSPAYDRKNWFYNIIENKDDSLIFYQVKDGISNRWGGFHKQILNVTQIDTTQFKNYDLSGKEYPSLYAKVLWQTDFNSTMLSDLITNGSDIFATTENGKIFCYDTSGTKLWEYDSKENIAGRPVVSSNTIVIATLQGDLISLNAITGQLNQVIGIGEPLTSQLVTTNINYNGSPTNCVIVGTTQGSLYCYSMDTFEMVWENHSAKGLIRTLPLITEHRLFFGSQDGWLYCIDSRTGVLYWKWNQGNDFFTAPAVCPPLSDSEGIYISTPDKYISKIDFLLGVTKWRKELQAWESLGFSNDNKSLVVKTIVNEIYFVSKRDGKIERAVNLKYGFDLNPTKILEWGGTYLIAAENGIIYLIDKNYRWKPLFFSGDCRLNSVIHIDKNIFAASNMDGRVICFELQ